MAGVWMTPCKNGQCELSVRRDGVNKIVIATQTPLTDGQVEELFWCIGAMQRSGKTLKDLLKEQEDAVRCKNCQFYNEGENEVDSWMRCRLHSINTSPDEFCSWAVKIML